MAFTQQNEKDGYLFFAIAFNAVPGKTYAAQVVQAYEAGMTTQQIVNEFTTKTAFTDIYGADLSNADFAQSFVVNVTAGLVTPIAASVQAKAIADIEAALDAGLSVGDVIFNVITNISNKSTADSEWGPLVQMLANKVAVAEALTEGEYALDTTDAGALQGPLASVSEDYATVADAIAKGGALKALLANALAADKAQSDYAASLGLTFDADTDAALGSYVDGDAVTSVADVTALVTARVGEAANDSLSVSYATYKAMSATQKSQAIAAAKTDAANDIALAKDDLATANTNVGKVATLAKKGADLAAADAALLAAKQAAVIASGKVDSETAAFNVDKAAAADQLAVDSDEFYIGRDIADPLTTPGTKVIELVSGKYAFVAGTSAAKQTALKAVLDAANASVAADKVETDATTAQADANAAVVALDSAAAALNIAGVTTAKQLLATVTTAKTALTNAETASSDLEKALADLATYSAELTKLDSLQKAVTEASDKLDDAGYQSVTLAGGTVNLGAVGVKDKVVLLVSGATDGDTELSNFKSDDHIYVGSGYTVNATGDLTKGSNSALEVFFKTNAAGTETDIYIEQKAFGSSVAGAADGKLGDIIKITLTGVTADKLVFQDGMISVAA